MKKTHHKIVIYYAFKTLNYLLILSLAMFPVFYFMAYDNAIHTHQMKGFNSKEDFGIFLFLYFVLAVFWLIVFIIYKMIKSKRDENNKN